MPLVVFLLLTGLAGFIGAQFGPGSWYVELNKPAWNPPNQLFGPVWTTLYVLIAVSGWRVWQRRKEAWTGPALSLWGAQLVVNAVWSWLFFGLHRPDLALLDILGLLLLIVAYICVCWRHDRIAAWLFLPYALWVGFATVLNATIWQMN